MGKKRPISKDRKVDDLIVAVIDQWGQERIKQGGKKILAYPPQGGRPIPIPHSPGDNRAFYNTRARLRSAGLDI